MKLIDLLVQELPKQGGWPTASEGLALPLAGNDLVTSWRYNYEIERFVTCTYGSEVVTREEYEAAIAASQQPAWNGEGLPPAGCECLVTPHNNLWGFSMCGDYRGKVIAYKGERFWFEADFGDDIISRTDKVDFKPIRSEAERKREESISKIQSHAHVDFVAPISTGQAVALYDAIAAGKIPNVTLK